MDFDTVFGALHHDTQPPPKYNGFIPCRICGAPLPAGLLPSQREKRDHLCDSCAAAQKKERRLAAAALRAPVVEAARKARALLVQRRQKEKRRLARQEREAKKQLHLARLELLKVLRKPVTRKKRADNINKHRKAYLEKISENYDPNELRVCKHCGEEKPLHKFKKDKHTGRCTGYVCRTCVQRKKIKRIKLDPERYDAYRAKHEKRKKRKRDRERAKRPHRPVLSAAERFERAKESKRQSKEKARKDPMHRINRNFSENIRRQFRNMRQGKACGGWKRHVGYTLLDLKRHLEAQFTNGMTWDNYGEWHIDHIIPKSAFTFTTPDDPRFLACWALDNLRPLWARENSAKCDTIPDTHLTEYVTIMCFPELL